MKKPRLFGPVTGRRGLGQLTRLSVADFGDLWGGR
jgi:hypothetical protein